MAVYATGEPNTGLCWPLRSFTGEITYATPNLRALVYPNDKAGTNASESNALSLMYLFLESVENLLLSLSDSFFLRIHAALSSRIIRTGAKKLKIKMMYD